MPRPMSSPELIASRYRIISQLGEGGMGVVYRAWDSERDVPVVVKMPKADKLSDRDFIERFNREIKAMAGLAHPHIVPIVGNGQDETGRPYVAMRFLPGGSLSDRRRRGPDKKPVPGHPSLLHHWLPAIADALDFVHRSGVIHRDVKPDNIFFDARWNAFLGDFGVAKVVETGGAVEKDATMTATGMAVGTHAYMAPEVFSNKPVAASDQYSLAITVYELLAGTRPFTGESSHIIAEHLTMPVPPLKDKQPQLPARLCEAVHRALSKKPEDRFETCGEFAAALLKGVPVPSAKDGVTRVMCPACHAMLDLNEKVAGKSGKCRKCSAPVTVSTDLEAVWLLDENPIRSRKGAGESSKTPSTFGNDPAAPQPNGTSQGIVLPSGTRTATVIETPQVETLTAEQTWEPRVLPQKHFSIPFGWGSIFTLAAVFSFAIYVLVLVSNFSIPLEDWINRFEAMGQPSQPVTHLGGFRNSLGVELKLIPAGTFIMGDTAGESGEEPHRVTLTRPFYMGVHEVTNAQWKQVMGSVPSNWTQANHPVEQVSWEDAVEFCRRLSALPEERNAGRVYRLPTEAEWEYACRAGTTTKYSFGEDEKLFGGYGWFDRNSGGQTHPVGQKKPNAWGLYDMHGNVREWCSDRYGYYSVHEVTNPQGPSSGSNRVYRGGCFRNTAEYCRSVSRLYTRPSDRHDFLGCRLALSSSGAELPEAGTDQGTKISAPSEDSTPAAVIASGSIPISVAALNLPERIASTVGITLRLIPAGTFTMGDTGRSDEKPHRVTLTRPVYIGVHEVTNAQWKQVMGSVPSNWTQANHPVEQVSWEDAVEFCRRLSALPEERNAGRVYRLPTEAEWEYACRAGTTTKYSFGDDEKLLGEYGWFDRSSAESVGQKKPNAWGLYDMHGNVSEWCSDWYGDYSDGEVINQLGPLSGSIRAYRGGDWDDTASRCRSAFRGGSLPSHRFLSLGFRLALSPSGAESPEAGK